MSIKKHIEYLPLGNFEEAEARGWHGAGWYFWDECDGQNCYGPFSSSIQAEEELENYAKYINNYGVKSHE